MPKQLLLSSFSAGLLSAILFMAGAAAGLGFFFMFLPTLPLLYAGLGKDPRIALTAGTIAALLVGLAGGLPLSILFFLSLVLPSWVMTKQGVLSRTNATGEREWFPIGQTMLQLCIFACAIVSFGSLFYASQHGSLNLLVGNHVREAFADLKNEYGEVIEALANRWAFLIFSITIWLWGLALYAHGWIANKLLAHKGKNIRPDFAITPFTLPNWMFFLLAVAALASLIGGESMRFLGKAMLIALMLPYFFQGAAIMHKASSNWPSRKFFLFFIYLVLFSQFWPALILSGIGIFDQVKSLNKHLSSGGGSSSN